ncbi:MAG: arylsulfatase [Bacteroidota bacterium]
MILLRLTALCLTGWLIACQPDVQIEQKPNIILIMVDDMGFSDIGPYGGEIPTPNLDRLAANGLRFSQFYNTARCCPTRASLLTGLFPHQTGIGQMTNPPTKQPYKAWGTEGYIGYLNRRCVTMAEVLKTAGYQTYMTGKWHLGYHEQSRWPRQRGFDRFYGIIAGASSYFKPQGNRGLTIENTSLPPPDTAYYATDAFTTYAMDFIEEGAEDKPYFLYLAYNAPHWPLQAKEEDIALFADQYRQGWDQLRADRHQKQIESGLLDEDWALSARDERVRAWDQLSQLEQDSVAYRMAVYAAQVYSVDQNIGRLLDFLEERDELDNSLIFFLSDNGGCAEMYDELGTKPHHMINNPDFAGAVSYGIGWANASNTPFFEYKVKPYEGGISTPLIVHWPEGLNATQGSITHQLSYLIDLMPTVLAVSGASYPERFHDGQEIYSLEGKSLLPLLQAQPYQPHKYLYWEHQNYAAIRRGPWKAIKHLNEPDWELYQLDQDRTETQNIALAHPHIIAELDSAWQKWAYSHQVLPKKK